MQEIGAGSYGKVYKIRRHDIGGTYYAALKVISVSGDDDEYLFLRETNMSESQIRTYFERQKEKLSREITLMEQLKGYTNIVSYEDHKIVPQADGIGCIIMIRMELLTCISQVLSSLSNPSQAK